MDSIKMTGAGIRAREYAMNQMLDNPDRRHDRDGIGEALNQQNTLHAQFKEAADLAFAFLADIASPDGYGHAVSPEIVKRASRILAMLRPKVCERPTGVGYMEPPPARCQACEES